MQHKIVVYRENISDTNLKLTNRVDNLQIIKENMKKVANQSTFSQQAKVTSKNKSNSLKKLILKVKCSWGNLKGRKRRSLTNCKERNLKLVWLIETEMDWLEVSSHWRMILKKLGLPKGMNKRPPLNQNKKAVFMSLPNSRMMKLSKSSQNFKNNMTLY